MTHAEQLRKHAELAMREGGMYYSGEYLSGMAKVAESLEAESAKLRELCSELLDNLMPEICDKAFWCRDKDWHKCDDYECGNFTFVILARELGVEVGECRTT